jgi:uncharacterized repeat protein (TIGR03803 family)
MNQPHGLNCSSLCKLLRSGAAGLFFAAIAVVPRQASSSDLTVLHSFGYQPDGEYPEGRLVQGSDGTLYGTTYGGGVNGYGMAFSIAPDGTLTTLHSFNGADGQQLDAGMTFGSDGNLYGTTPQGSTCINSNCTGFGGTVFKLTTAGALTTIHSFAGNGLPDGNSPGDLTDGGDGYFYGTTAYGGAAGVGGFGTVFKVAPNGTLTTLHSFTSAEPFYPLPGLTLGADGNFYGVTQYGPGNNANGTIIMITPAGAVSTVHSFNGTDGAYPGGKLLLARDGNFYGTTGGGGAAGAGTIYRLTPAGTLATLYEFNGGDGDGPAAGLVQTADGKLYGVTSGGGESSGGTLFRMTLAGTLTTLHLFTFADGKNPAVGPILGRDGLLYGTAVQGGGGNGILPTGTVFEFDPAAPHPPVLSLTKVCFNELNECIPPFDSIVGGYVGLVWYSANVRDCRASGHWLGSKPTGGSIEFRTLIPGSHTYTLSCRSANGPVTASATITVAR